MCERRERERMSFVSHRCGCCVLECCICCTHVPALLAAGNVQLSLLTYLQVYSGCGGSGTRQRGEWPWTHTTHIIRQYSPIWSYSYHCLSRESPDVTSAPVS